MAQVILCFLLLCAYSTTCLAQANPYISRVYEYCPAPGQFVNELPEYEEDDSPRMMRAKAEEAIAQHNQQLITLGGWGGYITFGFDHMLINVPGAYDLKILGNAFYADGNPNDTSAIGGSAEPGIVMVSYDANGNGMPDDPWYELAGSEYYKPETRHHYSLTYYRPDEEHTPTPSTSQPYLTDTTYIRWTDSEGQVGYMARNSYHPQDYFPMWLEDEDELTFHGTLLRPNGVDEGQEGAPYYVLYCFDWGYVDNQPNQVANRPELHASEFDLSWAVDDNGQSVQLDGIHFVRVYTGVNQYCGWLGETSTEILDAWDLHPNAHLDLLQPQPDAPVSKTIKNGTLRILRAAQQFDILGNKVE